MARPSHTGRIVPQYSQRVEPRLVASASSPAPVARPALLRLYPALASGPFRLLWLGTLPSMLAWQMNVVAAPYAAFALVGSATVLGVVSLATGVPMLLLSLVGGVMADRLPRRKILLATQGSLALGAAIIAVLTLRGMLQVWHLVALGLTQGIAFSFNMPARQAYMADLVDRPLLGNAVALNNAGMNFCRIVGPAIAGALLALPAAGVGGVFVAIAAMYVTVWLSLLRLPDRPPGGQTDRERSRPTSGREQLLEGLRYLGASPVLLGLLGSAFVALFFGMPYQTLMPLFAERVFEVGAGGLGALMAAVGVGALAGSLAVAAVSQSRHLGRIQVALGIGFGLALVGFALAPSFPLAIVALLLVGFLSAGYTAVNST